MDSSTQIIDEALAIQNAGGNVELARDLYRMLQEELPVYLEKVRQCYEQGDYAALYQQVHKLNGSATYCGVPALKQAAHAFDSHLKQQAEEHYASDLDELLRQIERLLGVPGLAG